jgi:hypothetical protein
MQAHVEQEIFDALACSRSLEVQASGRFAWFTASATLQALHSHEFTGQFLRAFT